MSPATAKDRTEHPPDNLAANLTELFGQNTERYGFTGACSTCNETMAVGHFG
jgi:hypothetical protein